MNALYQQQLRPLQIPPDYVLQPLPNNQYTDDQITQLYYMFLACYSERMNRYTKQLIKGVKCEIDCETKYLLMAIWILRGWYNPSMSISFVLGEFFGNYNVSMALEVNYGDLSLNWPVWINAIGNTPLAVLAAIQALLPANQTITLNEDQTVFTVKITAPLFPTFPSNLQWIVITQPADEPPGFLQWYEINPVVPCISAATIEKIIEKCIDGCGGINCMTNIFLTRDNYYVPWGQQLNPSELPVSLQPLPFFHY